MNLKNIHKV